MKKNTGIRSFRHLKKADRDEIEILLGRGYGQREIAHVLGVGKSTVSREIARRKRRSGIYNAATAEHKARVKRLHSKYQGMKVEACPSMRQELIRGLAAHRSPDEIAGRINEEAGYTVIGKDAIYRWLYSSWGNKYAQYLCTRRRWRRWQKRKTKREMIPQRIPLSMRPPGGTHGEGDLFVSPRNARTPASVAVVVENESKYLWGQRVRNRKPETLVSAMQEMRKTMRLDDLTLDNGIENKKHTEFGIQTYFCDPRRPQQKPHIETAIGLIRRWFIPKGTNLRTVSEEMLQAYLRVLNGKYRKSLGYRSAYEVARERGILKTKIPAARQEPKVQERVAFEVRI